MCWDLRGDVSAPVLSFGRLGFNNQRIMFDVDDYGNLVTGDTVSFKIGQGTGDNSTLDVRYRMGLYVLIT